jgi:hypothetical protein
LSVNKSAFRGRVHTANQWLRNSVFSCRSYDLAFGERCVNEMTEKIFNLFVFVSGDCIRELGVVVHEGGGEDSEKLAFLRNRAKTDASLATKYSIPQRYTVKDIDGTFLPGLNYLMFQRLTNSGRVLEVFDEVLTEQRATQSPLICITPVVDGVPRIGGVSEIPSVSPSPGSASIVRFGTPDYLLVYMTDEGFDLASLLNDDYFRAIKLLFNSRLYVSCLKLLMSFIDTIAYLDVGDIQGGFKKWLENHVELDSLGVTAEELWEFRNSLLHVTGVDSRKVLAGKVRRISFYLGQMPAGLSVENTDIKYFDLHRMLFAVFDGIEKWIEDFKQTPEKIRILIERYDRVLSDVRYEVISPSDALGDSSAFSTSNPE